MFTIKNSCNGAELFPIGISCIKKFDRLELKEEANVRECPCILTVLRAKYPYFFVDEFQDTSPVQSYILNEIGKQESVIGVIGDKAQAIYGFQGAEVKLFNNFKINKNYLYTIEENHRSDKKIVDFLNVICCDLSQKPCNIFPESMIKLYVEEKNNAFQEARRICGKSCFFI